MRIKIYYVPSVMDSEKTIEEHYEDAKKLFRKRLSGKADRIYISEAHAAGSVALNLPNFPKHKYFEFEIEIMETTFKEKKPKK